MDTYSCIPGEHQLVDPSIAHLHLLLILALRRAGKIARPSAGPTVCTRICISDRKKVFKAREVIGMHHFHGPPSERVRWVLPKHDFHSQNEKALIAYLWSVWSWICVSAVARQCAP